MRILLANCIIAFLSITLHAQPQVGGGVCTNSIVSGTYYYLLTGNVLSGNQVAPDIELGKFVADGIGGLSGNSHASVAGSISAYTFTGTYSVQSNCTGIMTLLVNSKSSGSFTFQVVNGGQGLMVAIAGPGAVTSGRAYRQTASAGSIQCQTASLSGSYAYLLSGVAYVSGNSYQYTQTGSITGDGLGHMGHRDGKCQRKHRYCYWPGPLRGRKRLFWYGERHKSERHRELLHCRSRGRADRSILAERFWICCWGKRSALICYPPKRGG
jgi:hypothetical protein